MSKIKNEATIGVEFSNMLSLAKAYFNTNTSKKFEYHQCLILRTTQGEEKVYSFTCNSVKDLINQGCEAILQEKITTVEKIVCMWEGEAIDVPSNRFMKTLCEVNPENKNAEILLSAGPNAYVTKKIADIIG
jgi:hypothetical protein